jgi:hypothetical protein
VQRKEETASCPPEETTNRPTVPGAVLSAATPPALSDTDPTAGPLDAAAAR